MLFKECYTQLEFKYLLCEIVSEYGYVYRTILKRHGIRIFDEIRNQCFDTISIISYESWSDDVDENNRKFLNYIQQEKTKIDFLKKLCPDHSSFCEDYYLAINKSEFVKLYFKSNLEKAIEVKMQIIISFCDAIVNEIKNENGDDICFILDALTEIKHHKITDISNFEEWVGYWPTLLNPNPFEV